jgi:uncharacterized membrane protein YhiD involved in acid resistance
MKQRIFVLAAGLLCGLGTWSVAAAQTSKIRVALTSIASMDKAIEPTSTVNSRALRDFKKNYPQAESENWTTLDKGWEASFLQGDIRSVVVYNRHGDWQYGINYYTEDQLPREVRTQVKSKYFDYSISGVEEVHVLDKVAYLVHLQDAHTWKVVRVCDGNMDLMEDYNKE